MNTKYTSVVSMLDIAMDIHLYHLVGNLSAIPDMEEPLQETVPNNEGLYDFKLLDDSLMCIVI